VGRDLAPRQRHGYGAAVAPGPRAAAQADLARVGNMAHAGDPAAPADRLGDHADRAAPIRHDAGAALQGHGAAVAARQFAIGPQREDALDGRDRSGDGRVAVGHAAQHPAAAADRLGHQRVRAVAGGLDRAVDRHVDDAAIAAHAVIQAAQRGAHAHSRLAFFIGEIEHADRVVDAGYAAAAADRLRRDAVRESARSGDAVSTLDVDGAAVAAVPAGTAQHQAEVELDG